MLSTPGKKIKQSAINFRNLRIKTAPEDIQIAGLYAQSDCLYAHTNGLHTQSDSLRVHTVGLYSQTDGLNAHTDGLFAQTDGLYAHIVLGFYPQFDHKYIIKAIPCFQIADKIALNEAADY